MKITFIFFSLILLSFSLKTQTERPYDSYLIEENTYITNAVKTPFGLYFSDNYCNAIYKYDGTEMTIVLQAPGCGRYLQVSPDRTMIGFKLIDESGMQTPAILNTASGEITRLHSPVSQCGQVFFTAGGYYYTIQDVAIITENGHSKEVNLGQISNYIAYSSSLNLIVFADFNDQLFVLDITTGIKEMLTDNSKGYVFPAFSPDGLLLAIQAGGEEVYIHDFSSRKTTCIDHGNAFRWATGNVLYYNTFTIGADSILRADIKKWEDGVLSSITNTPDISEMQPIASGHSTLTYHTYDNRSVYELNPLTGTRQLLYQSSQPLPVKFFEIKSGKAVITVPGTVPYIHQVYDTPSWHYGYGSCAPTSSVMSFAYYNQLPPWPVSVSHGYSWDPHISPYGSYIADRYRFNEYYYQETETTSGGTTAYGGHGFMWTGSYSPNSRMEDYHIQHYHSSYQCWTTGCPYSATVSEIDQGYVHPICNYLTTSGHVTLAIGYVQGQQTLVFNDPYGSKNTPGYPSYDGAGVFYDWPGANNGYANLGGSYSYIAWSVRARQSELASYNDTIIDNNYYGHGFHVNNTQAGSHQRYFRDFNVGYNGHTWYTMTDAGIPDICWVTWTPTLPQSGYYEVYAHIPSNGATCHDAPYRVHHNNGVSKVVINQNNYSNQWVSLGIYQFTQGQNGYVYLGDSTSTDGEMIAYDAMKWSYRPAATASFTSSAADICMGSTITFTSTSTYSTTYSWQFPGGTPAASSGTNPTITYNNPGVYDVTLNTSNSYSSATQTQVSSVVVHDHPIASFTAQNVFLSLPAAEAVFTNQSTNASQYLWNFGDGYSSTDIHPSHQYTSAGNFTVQLTAIEGTCPDAIFIANEYIHVDDPTNIPALQNEEYLFYSEGKLFYHFHAEPEIFAIVSADGRTLLSISGTGTGGYISVAHFDKGIYFCNVMKDNNKYRPTHKFCIF
jgi:PKD repeat protein